MYHCSENRIVIDEFESLLNINLQSLKYAFLVIFAG